MNFFILLSSIILSVLGQFFLKRGVATTAISLNFNAIIQTLLSPLVLVGLFFYGMSAIIWLFVLQKFSLSVAYPSLSLSYIAVIVIGAFVFNEPLTWGKVFGSLLILLGVIFINR